MKSKQRKRHGPHTDKTIPKGKGGQAERTKTRKGNCAKDTSGKATQSRGNVNQEQPKQAAPASQTKLTHNITYGHVLRHKLLFYFFICVYLKS